MPRRRGLTSKEAKKRLEKYGPNRLPEKGPPGAVRIFLSQFKSPLVYVLLFGTLVALALGEFSDALVILLALLVNAFLGFYQEKKASRALASLKAILHPQAVVVRDGRQKKIPVEEIVLGDLVVLNAGDKVPADGELVETVDLTVREAILTGESMPARKEIRGIGEIGEIKGDKNIVFMGTTVVSGRALFEVTKTGVETEMGKIAKSLEEGEEATPLQKQLGRLAKQLTVIIIIVCLGLLIGGFLRGWEFSEVILTSLSVAVAAIPEGLVVSLTVILALGMQVMARKKGLVRKLVAAETLGGVTVICADKTGTLTAGEMKATEAITSLDTRHGTRDTGHEKKEELFIKSAVLCNNLSDPLEVAMLDWALRRDFGGELSRTAQGKQTSEVDKKTSEVEEIKREYPRIDEIPFDPKKKWMATLHRVREGGEGREGREYVMFVHGAPEVILRKSTVDSRQSTAWLEKIKEFGEEGYRMVGFAYKKILHTTYYIPHTLGNLTWQGLLLFEDPVRPGVAEALKDCQRAGIKVKVITGDYPGTALAVLRKLKIVEEKGEVGVIRGDQLGRMSEDKLRKRVGDVVLFARTKPEQKLKIVKALKANGEVVAMTGDGVNDAPALSAADIGIVVAEASDVAKETADLVLLDSNFATIVKAVSVGRSIFENIKKVVLYLLSSSFTEVILIGGGLLLGLPLPLLPAQILWVNLVEDSLPAMALAMEKEEEDLLEVPPRHPGEGIFDAELKILIFIIGMVTDLALFGIFGALYFARYPMEIIRTVLFLGLAIDSLFFVFACRNLRKNIWHFNPFENKFLNLSVVLGFLFLVLAVYSSPLQALLRTVPLPAWFWLVVLGIGVFNLLAIEMGKWGYLKIGTRRTRGETCLPAGRKGKRGLISPETSG